MAPTRDGDFIPPGGFKPIEHGLPRTYLQEMLEGHQVAMLHYLDDVGPTGSRGLAFELTDGAKLIVWAGRDRYSRFSARLFFRRLDPPRVVLPETLRVLSGGRARDPALGPPDALQERVEGAMVKNVVHHRVPTEAGGEALDFEFSGGARLRLTAVPMERVRGGEMLLADVQYEFVQPERTRVVMP